MKCTRQTHLPLRAPLRPILQASSAQGKEEVATELLWPPRMPPERAVLLLGLSVTRATPASKGRCARGGTEAESLRGVFFGPAVRPAKRPVPPVVASALARVGSAGSSAATQSLAEPWWGGPDTRPPADDSSEMSSSGRCSRSLRPAATLPFAGAPLRSRSSARARRRSARPRRRASRPVAGRPTRSSERPSAPPSPRCSQAEVAGGEPAGRREMLAVRPLRTPRGCSGHAQRHPLA